MGDFDPGQYRILLVEDDESLSQLLLDEISDAGYQVFREMTAEQGLRMVRAQAVDLVISDLRLPGMTGLEFLEALQRQDTPPACIVITGFGTISQAVQALKAGADDFLTKPLHLEHLMLSVRRVLGNRLLRQELAALRLAPTQESFHGMVGHSDPMTHLYAQIRQVARAYGPVLITGESGVGKELVARAIHRESERRQEAFVAINCAGIPENLMESEFFGHVAGSFTGARSERRGLISDAHGGTLLLDEIGEMPLPLQAKLLRVIQEGVLRPVGGNREEKVDVRVLAATNRDLEEEMRQGRFREDLFYRLETFALHVPPLRDRGDDLELLAARFLEQMEQRLGRRFQGFSEEALSKLRQYPFPGNVRELQNAMERAATFCRGSRIQPQHLPARIRQYRSGSDPSAPFPIALTGEDGFLSLEELQRRYIQYVVEQLGGNKRRAASVLGIGRRTLYRKLGVEE
ncbi:sigma-54 factor interaction domain-containing protein [Desulfurispirillum indicum S5]|uniref:Sigma-54 factor interaction domain-containing protein n=1 Tax=Desulfurispirillum indicum (strain ATCC BAA-1389 / DSM 22839 / S5) TaxID=653733 RepID=E6W764_DESIS|nr:sigma 54-interacting transcriptional regulator [Desulfurispirillum indicum]ADU65142.1 sigma-54 factor interaction domain-containing protein [Desulfurispirillum indicum S5]